MENKFYILLDIDGVLATMKQFYSKKRHEEWNCYRFDEKCVKVFNNILNEIPNPVIVLSSDWKHHYNLETLNNIFKWNGIDVPISDVTPDLWGVKYNNIDDLEKCRADEINTYVADNNIENWVAIDDLDLDLPSKHFVRTPRQTMGIKQSGVKDKILKKIQNV